MLNIFQKVQKNFKKVENFYDSLVIEIGLSFIINSENADSKIDKKASEEVAVCGSKISRNIVFVEKSNFGKVNM